MNDLAIVILHYNTPKDVEENLRALQNAILPEKVEIVVVNNGGDEANKKIHSSFHKNLNVRFFDIPNKGFPQGNNFAIDKTDAKYIAIVNPDIEVNKNTFKTLLDYHKMHPKIGITAPRLIYPTGITQDNYRVFPRPFDLIVKRIPLLRKIFLSRMRKYLMWDKEPTKNEAVDWVTGAFQILTRKCWEEVGPNCEDYFLFMSDVEICRDAWNKNYEVHFVGQATAKHNESRLSAGNILDVFRKKTVRIHIKDAFIYFKKFFRKKLSSNCPSSKTK